MAEVNPEKSIIDEIRRAKMPKTVQEAQGHISRLNARLKQLRPEWARLMDQHEVYIRMAQGARHEGIRAAAMQTANTKLKQANIIDVEINKAEHDLEFMQQALDQLQAVVVVDVPFVTFAPEAVMQAAIEKARREAAAAAKKKKKKVPFVLPFGLTPASAALVVGVPLAIIAVFGSD